jgi:Glu-tRNA(Gln) amidotransferase subunit E-like FAD-binding protein
MNAKNPGWPSKVVLVKDHVGVVRNVILDDNNISNVVKAEIVAEPDQILRLVLTINIGDVCMEELPL